MRSPARVLRAPNAVTSAQAISVLTVAVFLDALIRGVPAGNRGNLLISLQLAAALAACWLEARRSAGSRRLLFLGITAALFFSLLGRSWAGLHQLVHGVPGIVPVLEIDALLLSQSCLALGLAAALGRRYGRIQLESGMDALLLVAAAAIVTVQLDYLPAHDGDATVRALSTVWNAMAAANLVLVALLLAWRGEFLGTRTAVGLSLGTLALAMANMLYSRAMVANTATVSGPVAILWSITTFAFASAADTRRHTAAALSGEMPEFGLQPSAVRVISVVVAILIASFSGMWVHVRGQRSLPLGVAIAVFGVLLAVRAGYALLDQQRVALRLEGAVVAEREIAVTLEQRVALRTHELGEAHRVLQRMWALAQQIALDLDRDRVLNRVMEAVVDVVRADAGAVGLKGDDGAIHLAAAVGFDPPVQGTTLDMDASAMGIVIRSGGAWWSEDLRDHGGQRLLAEASFTRDGPVRGIAIVPLQRRGERIGAVAICSLPRRRFTAVELSHVEAMADLLSVALANAELVDTLRTAESRFRTLFRAAPDAVLTVLEDGRVREANDAVRDIIGVPPAEIGGLALEELVHPEDAELVRYELAEALSGAPTRLEVRFPGHPRLRRVALAARLLPDAEPRAVLFIGRDITGEQEMRSRLAETERLAAVGELVAGVAHEVNNPLSTISAFAQLMLRDDALTEAQRESAEVIQSETHRAGQVLRDLLTFARRSEGDRLAVQMNELVERSTRLRSFEMTKLGVRCQLALDSTIPAVLGDGRQLQQVILNLVTNAVQAIAPKGGGCISIATRQENGRVLVEVRDSGGGIPDSARDHIFEPFFTTKSEGTGLGLSVSYGIVTAHGGEITITDSSPEGTTFLVSLPAADDAGLPGAAPEAARRLGASVLKGRRLLFVDDEPALRSGVCAFGRLRRFTVVTAEHGEAALAATRAERFDAVVCDLRMPGMDGPTFYEQLRRENPHLAQRTLFITGDVVSPASRSFLDATSQPVLTKPFEFDRLEESLVALLAGHAPATVTV